MRSNTQGKEGRAALLAGAEKLAQAVGSTMGPQGRNVVFDPFPGKPAFPTSSRDGVTVARNFYLSGVEDTGNRMVREAAAKAVEEAGDGTTAAVVLAHAIFKAGIAELDAGKSVVAVKKEIERDVKTVCEEVDKVKIKLHGPMIDQVATIAANNDPVLGKIIADTMRQAGPNGVFAVEESTDAETTIEHREGMQFDCGYLSKGFVNNVQKMTVEFANPVILLLDRVLTSMQGLLPVIESLAKQERPILVIAEDVKGEALATFVEAKLNGAISICAVRAPANLGHRQDLLMDIAALTGGQAVLQERGMDLSKGLPPGTLGVAKKVIITSSQTRIIGGYGKKAAQEKRVEEIKGLLSQPCTKLEKERLQERLAKLTGGATILKLGAYSGLELGDKKDRCEDACFATRAAIKEGIVPGGGFTLARIAEKLPDGIVKSAIVRPMHQIMENAGYDTNCHDFVEAFAIGDNFNIGYNSLTGEYCDLVEAGVIDPALVIKSSLRNAASVATTMLLTNLVIQEQPKEK